MCPQCFTSGFAGFPTYHTFAAFEAQLLQKLAQRQLRPVPPEPALAVAVMAPEQLYHCPACDDTWALSSPDNAWRGYFLPTAAAAAYVRQRQRREAIRGWGCGAVVAALLIFLIIKWANG